MKHSPKPKEKLLWKEDKQPELFAESCFLFQIHNENTNDSESL